MAVFDPADPGFPPEARLEICLNVTPVLSAARGGFSRPHSCGDFRTDLERGQANDARGTRH